VLLRNTNPSGDVWVGDLGRDVTAGEEVDVPDEVAGRAPSGFVKVDVPERSWCARVADDGGWEEYDPGVGLLAQVGNWEVVTVKAAKAAKPTEVTAE